MIKQNVVLFVIILLSCTSVYAESDNYFQFKFASEEACSDCEKIFDVNSNKHIWIEKRVVLSDKDIKVAEVKMDKAYQANLNKSKDMSESLESPIILLTLTESGKEKFAKITGRNIGRRLAVFVESKYVMSPTIHEEIDSGQLQILGPISVQEAESIVKKFKAKIGKND